MHTLVCDFPKLVELELHILWDCAFYFRKFHIAWPNRLITIIPSALRWSVDPMRTSGELVMSSKDVGLMADGSLPAIFGAACTGWKADGAPAAILWSRLISPGSTGLSRT